MLAETRDQYLDLYDFAPFGYLTLTAEGTILDANFMAAKLLGVERQQLRSTDFYQFLSRKSADQFYLHQQAVLAGESRNTCEIELRGNAVFPPVIRLESIADHDQSAKRCRSAMIDITERKFAEKKLLEAQETLESRVHDRTLQLYMEVAERQQAEAA